MRVRYGGDRDRIGCGAGRADRAESEVVAVVAGGDHRHDAGRDDVVNRLDHRIVRRIRLRTAAREVDHVHPVGDGRLECGDDLRRVRDVPDRSRHGEHAVVADPGSRRDAGQPAGRRMVGSRRRRRPRVASCDPGHVRSVERRGRIDRQPPGLPRVRTREDLRHDHLRRRPLRPALREARGIREAGRVEERALLVDAVVDDSDLDAGAVRAAHALEDVGADHPRTAVRRERVGRRRIEPRDGRQPCELRQLSRLQRHHDPVEQDREAAADLRVGDRSAERRHGAGLGGALACDVRARGAGVDVEPAVGRGRSGRAAERGRERRQREADDHAHRSVRVTGGDPDRPVLEARNAELSERAVDRHESRGRGNGGRERRAERGESEGATQGSAAYLNLDPVREERSHTRA